MALIYLTTLLLILDCSDLMIFFDQVTAVLHYRQCIFLPYVNSTWIFSSLLGALLFSALTLSFIVCVIKT